MEFNKKYKIGDKIHFWTGEYGGYTSKIEKWCEIQKAYLTKNNFCIRENSKDIIVFDTEEELREYEKTHKRNKNTDCGHSFGCDFYLFIKILWKIKTHSQNFQKCQFSPRPQK